MLALRSAILSRTDHISSASRGLPCSAHDPGGPEAVCLQYHKRIDVPPRPAAHGGRGARRVQRTGETEVRESENQRSAVHLMEGEQHKRNPMKWR